MGKVLTDSMSLESEQVIDGSKATQIASQGLHRGVILYTLLYTYLVIVLRKNILV